ncbi:MAG: HEPN domain-containing protein, partial [Armatimonadota bacterium]|nr:HEPN domain-containing protein [Armatimonadota bacterium]
LGGWQTEELADCVRGPIDWVTTLRMGDTDMSAADSLKWIHEGRIALTTVQGRFTATNSLSGWDFAMLYRGVEMVVKAVEIASTGRVSHTHSLVVLSQKVGLWGTLPPEHQQIIRLLERYGPSTNYPDNPGHHTLTNSTSPVEANRILTGVSSLFDFVEHLVSTDLASP